MNIDNRLCLRYSFIEEIVLETPTLRKVIAESENISTGGVFLITDELLAVGTFGFLTVMVGLSDMKKEIFTNFRVSHVSKSGSGSRGIGVEFIDMPENHKILLEELIGGIS